MMEVKIDESSLLHIKRVLVLFICLIMILSLFHISVFAQSEGDNSVVRVGWFESPYNTVDENGRRTGYSYEYQRKIASYTGWTYEYVEGSWAELLDKLEKGEIDILSDVSYTKERSEKMLFPSYSMGTEEYYLYIRKEQVADFDENYSYFNGKKIGVNKGSLQTGLFKNWMKQYNIKAELVEVTTTEYDSLDMLANGEIDGYITIDTFVVKDNLIPAVKIGSSDFYFAVSKSRPDILNELDNAMSKVQDENRFYNQELFEKYIQNIGANRFLSKEEKKWLSEHSNIRVGYLDNYLAYCDKDDKDGSLTGALKDYLDKASTCFANGEMSFETTAYTTVDKALIALESGEVDCVFPANLSTYDAEKRGLVLTPTLARATLYMVVRSTEERSYTANDKVTVAVVSGDSNYESVLKEMYPYWQISFFENTNECLKAVSDGRADCFLISTYRHNSIRKQCDKFKLITLDTGRDIPFCFAVKEGETYLYSILAKTTNIIPDSYINNTLTYYYTEESKMTLLDVIIDNIFIVIAVVIIMIAMLLLIIVQRKLIIAEKKAKEHCRIADDLSRRVYVDALTSVRNKGGYTDYSEMLQDRIENGDITEFAICMFDCDDLKYINDKYGHEKGDEYLKTAARLICQVFRHSAVFRVGGDEFTSILQNDDYENRADLVRRFEIESKFINSTTENDWQKVNVSIGMAEYDSHTDKTIDDTAKRADERMYENKRIRKSGKNVR